MTQKIKINVNKRNLFNSIVLGNSRYSDKTVGDVVNEWKAFVEQCESGYDDCIDEYVNDIGVRLLIERIIETLPKELARKIITGVQELDSRFIKVTVSVKTPLLREAFFWLPKEIESKKEIKYWYTRIPRSPGPILKEELISMGLLRGE